MVFDMGFTKRIVSKQSIWTTWNRGPGMVEKWLDNSDTLISEDEFADEVVKQYHNDPKELDNMIREMLISD